MNGGQAARSQWRGLLWVGFGYLIAILVGTFAINVVTFTTPSFRRYPAFALFTLLVVPLWIYMLGGIWRRLHGDAQARIVPRVFIRILRFIFGTQAVLTGALGVADLIRYSTTGARAIVVAPVVVLVGGLLLYHALRR